MIQGGDPTATGKGGESIWGGRKLEDQFHPDLKVHDVNVAIATKYSTLSVAICLRLLTHFLSLQHNERGIISMANNGPDSNGSQFFIIYEEQPHLNNVNCVVGRFGPI